MVSQSGCYRENVLAVNHALLATIHMRDSATDEKRAFLSLGSAGLGLHREAFGAIRRGGCYGYADAGLRSGAERSDGAVPAG